MGGSRRGFLKLVGSTTVLAAGCAPDGLGRESANSTEHGADGTDYEFIVVGSGAGGGPLAANLARQGHRVLLLEAGRDRGDSLNYQVPAYHPKSTEDPTMRWDFFVKHYAEEARQAEDGKNTPKGVLYPRAGTLGGCTAHNAMITVLPHASDWDYVADLTGDDSWRPDEMRRYFEILERCEYLGKFDDPTGHGKNGWLATNRADPSIALGDVQLLTIVKAAAQTFAESQGNWLLGSLKELTSLMRRDLNSAAPDRDQREGLYTIPMATHGGRRIGPREYILKTVEEGYPLDVRTGALASRLLFDETPDDSGRLRAVAVEYLDGDHLYAADPQADASHGAPTVVVKATREIIVSAGAFNTPQLLKLSGIGPREELEALGIPVLVERPGVGTNLQDRYEVGIISELSKDFAALKGCTFGTDPATDPCLAKWQKGQGPYAANGTTVAIVVKSSPELPDPDLFVFGLPGYFKGYEPGYSEVVAADKHHFTWAVLKAHTKNTAGTVTLRSANPRDVPEIVFRYFDEGTTANGEDSADLEAVARGVELARAIGSRTDDLMWFGAFDEVFPGPQAKGPEQTRSFIKKEAWGHHASCTCPIGADDDPMAVLDSKLKVRGTTNLRVVDASVFPRIPGFFIVSSIYMVSEKATDEILAELGETRMF